TGLIGFNNVEWRMWDRTIGAVIVSVPSEKSVVKAELEVAGTKDYLDHTDWERPPSYSIVKAIPMRRISHIAHHVLSWNVRLMRTLIVFALLLLVGCGKPQRGDLLGDPFTLIGVPRELSTNTFQDIDGLERGLTVDVLKVTAGSFSERQ